jgi:signal transduction histidine kinase
MTSMPGDSAGAIAALEAQVAALTAELAETNQGVVALYAELDDNAVRLQEASELKSRFLSYMSHEFRTPLGSIRSLTRILTDRLDGPLTEEQEKQIRFIQDAATELSEMVDDLLDLAKVEAGRVTISPAWFEMVDLFSALRGMFKPILSSDKVSLIFEEPHGIPAVFTDDKKISQILRNFISNALKFTPSGEVRVRAAMNGDHALRFSVSDTGIGIPPEHLPAIFQDFVQVDSPIQKALRGSGLGLSLSKKLALMLGGDVAVESLVGVGSTFSVTIPIAIPGHERADPALQPTDGGPI